MGDADAGVAGRVPERASVVLERCELVGSAVDPAADVGHGEGGPVRDRSRLGGRPVRGGEAQGEFGEDLVTKSRRLGAGHAIGEERVGVLAVARHTGLHSTPCSSRCASNSMSCWPVSSTPLSARRRRGQLGCDRCLGENRLDGVGERGQAVGQRPQLLVDGRVLAVR